MGTVCKFLFQWKSGQIRQGQQINDTIDPSIVRAISNQIASRVQESTAEAIARLADLQSETDVIIADNERQSAEIVLQIESLEVLQEQRASLAGRIQQLEAEADRNAVCLAAERHHSETARVELAKAQLRLEVLPQLNLEIERIRAELLLSRTLAAELHEAAAVSKAKLEGEVMQRKVAETYHSEVAAREVAAAHEAARSARAEAKKSGEEAAELRGKLAKSEHVPVKRTAVKRVSMSV